MYSISNIIRAMVSLRNIGFLQKGDPFSLLELSYLLLTLKGFTMQTYQSTLVLKIVYY